MIIIGDKVYGKRKLQPLTEPEEEMLQVLRKILDEKREDLLELRHKGLEGFGDDSKALYWAKISRLENEIEQIKSRIAGYTDRQNIGKDVSIGISEEDYKNRGKRG